MSRHPKRQRQEGRAEECGRGDRSDCERLKPEQRQVDGQQDGDVAVGEGAERPPRQDPGPVGRGSHHLNAACQSPGLNTQTAAGWVGFARTATKRRSSSGTKSEVRAPSAVATRANCCNPCSDGANT